MKGGDARGKESRGGGRGRINYFHSLLSTGNIPVSTSSLCAIPPRWLQRCTLFVLGMNGDSSIDFPWFVAALITQADPGDGLQARGFGIRLLVSLVVSCSSFPRMHASRPTPSYHTPTDFTPMCKEVDPPAVMAMLNDLYSRYDKMLDEYGVFKVRTTAYIVVGIITVPKLSFWTCRLSRGAPKFSCVAQPNLTCDVASGLAPNSETLKRDARALDAHGRSSSSLLYVL